MILLFKLEPTITNNKGRHNCFICIDFFHFAKIYDYGSLFFRQFAENEL